MKVNIKQWFICWGIAFIACYLFGIVEFTLVYIFCTIGIAFTLASICTVISEWYRKRHLE